MSIGSNIKRLREERKLTQEQVAERIGVTFQAVSSWERNEYLPDTAKLVRLAEVFGVSVSAVVEERMGTFETKEAFYDWKHMKTYVKTTAKNLGLTDTYKAVDFAVKAHEGQTRKKSSLPYIYHPLMLACHVLALGITDDSVVAACLLHDVVEDCGKTLEDLPFGDEIRELVGLLTHVKTNDADRDAVMGAYYDAIAKSPKASLIKCLDRCNNITSMSWGLSRDRMYRMIVETEKYFPRLLDVLKATPEYNNAAWLLKYQMEGLLDVYKRGM